MVTSGLIWHALRAINLPVDIRNVCVLLAPGFAGLTAWATYLSVGNKALVIAYINMKAL